jgi:DNA-binding IclR family transcriptional regulator
MAEARERNGVQVIARAAQVLRALEHESEGLSLGEIAGRVDLARSTVQRIVSSLVDEQFLMPVSDRGRVRLGPALVRLGTAATADIVGLVRPYLAELSQAVGETVDLSTLRDDQAIFIDQVAGSHRLAAISQVGTVFPLHSTANGKAMLACLPADRRRMLLSRPLSQDTDATTTDTGKLELEVQGVLRSGIACDIEEHTHGICAVGTALLDAFDRPLAVSIPVPKTRYDVIKATLQEPLLATRDEIIKRIAGKLPPGETQR